MNFQQNVADGFGAGPNLSQNDLDELTKALTVGSAQNAPGSVVPGDGFALRVESLENTLKNVTFRMDHVRLWKSIPKIGASNTVEEHNVVSSYGEGDEGFIAEGGTPVEDDTSYERQFAVVKFLGTTRVVSHVATLIKPAHGNVIANETVAGTMHLLKMLERALFYGDSALSSLQFDGYEKLISANNGNVIDLRGQQLDEDVLVDAALTASDAPNYGIPTHLHLNPKTKADLVKTFFPKERYDLLSKQSGGMVGLDIRGFTSPAGDVAFEPNTFITDGGAPLANAAGKPADRPATPAITTPAAAGANAASLFGIDDAGSYRYTVTAHNDSGRSLPVVVTAGLAVVSGDAVTFGVTPGAANAPETKWFSVFRSKPDGTELRRIARIPNTLAAAETTITDLNASLPFTTSGFMFQQNLEAMSWKQLAPFLKIPLATTSTQARWMQLVYGVPVLYAPRKMVLFKNIGRAPNFVGNS